LRVARIRAKKRGGQYGKPGADACHVFCSLTVDHFANARPTASFLSDSGEDGGKADAF